MGDNSRYLISAQARSRARKWGGERLWNRQFLTEGGEEGRGVAERGLRMQHGARCQARQKEMGLGKRGRQETGSSWGPLGEVGIFICLC